MYTFPYPVTSPSPPPALLGTAPSPGAHHLCHLRGLSSVPPWGPVLCASLGECPLCLLRGLSSVPPQGPVFCACPGTPHVSPRGPQCLFSGPAPMPSLGLCPTPVHSLGPATHTFPLGPSRASAYPGVSPALVPPPGPEPPQCLPRGDSAPRGLMTAMYSTRVVTRMILISLPVSSFPHPPPLPPKSSSSLPHPSLLHCYTSSYSLLRIISCVGFLALWLTSVITYL